jgi:hypothetical protein
MVMRYRRSLVLASVVCVAAFSLLASGCGGSSEGGVANTGATTSESAGASSTPGGTLAEYAHCMRSHGISNFPDSFGSSAAIRTTKGQMNQISESEALAPRFEAAQRACAAYAPPSQTAAPVSPQQLQKLLAVSRCMRAHGVPTFPDPNPTTGELTTPAGIDKNSPQVLAALRACESLGRAAGLGPPNTG